MAAFGTVFMPEMTICRYEQAQWSEISFVPSDKMSIHPAAHVLHYASTCFEGLKAFKQVDGSIKIFRMDQNLRRFEQSSRMVSLPPIDTAQTQRMISQLVAKYQADVPDAPGSMYIRPTHIGTEAAIGKAAAATESSLQYVLLSPVGDYFSVDGPALRVLLDDQSMRCAPHNGMIKSGGNYASALLPINRAREQYQADQVLFCPGGWAQETGAANFLLFDGDELITKALDSTFLHGVTRDSILALAGDLGLRVSEREISIDELIQRAAKPGCEAALSGTAAVLAPVGTFIYNGKDHRVGSGTLGPITDQLRRLMNDIQWGRTEDTRGWLTAV